ncbi:GDSL-type esterase/lipase family protein [Myxococcota bacterium]|nr:GDSL-type esterase/lipase family protein [Myxococcota bacterium]
MLLAGLALLISLAGVEALFRLAGLGRPVVADDVEFRWTPSSPFQAVGDPDIAWGLRPGWTGAQVYLRMPEGVELHRAEVRVNALGLRGPELAPRSGGGAARLLLLGDSVTFGQGLAEEQTIPAGLARRLPGVEVVNGGTPGWCLRQQVGFLARSGAQVGADQVVVMLYVNDLQPVYPRPDAEARAKPAPAWARRESGLRRHSFVINLLARSIAARRDFAGWQAAGGAVPTGGLASSMSYLDQLRRDATPARARAELDRLAATCAHLAVPCTVAMLPVLIAEGEDEGQDLVELLVAAARQAGLPVVRLDGELSDLPPWRLRVFPGDQHPSAEAADLLAAGLAPHLRRSP